MLRIYRLSPVMISLMKFCKYARIDFSCSLKVGQRSMCTVKKNHIERNTVLANEVEKFHNAASDWWSTNDRFNVLLAMNSVRVPFVRDGLLSTVQKQKIKKAKPLEGFRIVDIGSGGGFFSEPLARLGANVTGIDPSSENVRVATEHASLDPALKGSLTYMCSTVEELVDNIEPFDAVVCSEVIEHVNNPNFFVECCAKLVKDNGSLFFTTFDKTSTSYFAGILLAEYVLGIIPKGTHDWKQFIPPSDLQNMLEHQHCQTQVIHGIMYNPITGTCSWCHSTSLQYALHAVKLSDF